MHDEKKKRRSLLAAELRSGRHEQGEGHLRQTLDDVDYWCCLGVACEVRRRETGLGSWASGAWGEPQRFTDETGDTSTTQLTHTVGDWYGLNVTGVYTARGLVGSLANDNDEGVPFTTIASTVESREFMIIMPTHRAA